MTELDTDKAGRRVWLVRVPPHIAEHWKAACSAPAAAVGGDDDGDDEMGEGAILGKIVIRRERDGQQKAYLELPEGLDPGAPREYLLQTANKESKQDREAPAPAPKELPPPNMAVISAEVPAPRGGHGGGGTHVFAAAPPEVRAPTGSEAPRLLKPRIDGQVSMKYDAVPAAAAKAVEQAVPSGSKGMNLNIPNVDAAYRALSRKRTVAALQKGRGVAMIDETSAKRILQGQNNRSSLYQKEKKEDKEDVQERVTLAREMRAAANPKRVKLERDDLTKLLFKMFERQGHWSLQALQKETDQPGAYLRDVLGEVAVQVKRGPHKDLWELQKQFKTGGGGEGGGGGDGA